MEKSKNTIGLKGVPMEFLYGDKETSIEYYKEVILEKSKREDASRQEDNDKKQRR